MSLLQNDFEKRWDDLSKDVKQLNEYMATRPVELRNIQVGYKDLEDARFVGATFTSVEWNGTHLKNASFTKTVFKDCSFNGSLHQGSVFTDVVFENCTFEQAEFGRSTFVNVRFINCRFTDTRLEDATGSELLFEDSHLETRTSLAGSAIPMTFRRCSLKGVGLSGMKSYNKLILEECFLDEVDFSRGTFSEVVIVRGRQGEGPLRFNDTMFKSIRFEDVEMNRGVGVAGAKGDTVSINGGSIKITFRGSTIDKIFVRDTNTVNFSVRLSNLPSVHIANSYLYDPMFCETFLGELVVQNSILEDADFEEFKGNHVVLHNVTLKGKVNFTDAMVENFKATEINHGPNLQLITTGSNLRF